MHNPLVLTENSPSSPPVPLKIKPKHIKFAQEYVKDLNQKQAAIRAGYSKNSAEVQGSKLIRITNVKAYIAQLQENVARELGIDHRYVLQSAKDGLELAIKDKNVMGILKGSELLGKRLGTFEPKIREMDQRPAFVGININMGDKPSLEILHSNPEDGGGGPPEKARAG